MSLSPPTSALPFAASLAFSDSCRSEPRNLRKPWKRQQPGRKGSWKNQRCCRLQPTLFQGIACHSRHTSPTWRWVGDVDFWKLDLWIHWFLKVGLFMVILDEGVCFTVILGKNKSNVGSVEFQRKPRDFDEDWMKSWRWCYRIARATCFVPLWSAKQLEVGWYRRIITY